MELTIQWFWLINICVSALIFGSLYKAWKTSKRTNKFWNNWTTISVILIVLQYMLPVKMDYTHKNNQIRNSWSKQIIEPSIVTIDSKKDNKVLVDINTIGIKLKDGELE